MFYVEVKWLLVVLKVFSNQVLHAYVWFSFFLRLQPTALTQPWRSCRAGDGISELKLNENLRWGNINHFIQLSSWRTWGVWTKRTARCWACTPRDLTVPGFGTSEQTDINLSSKEECGGNVQLVKEERRNSGLAACVAWILNSQLSVWVHMSCRGNFPPSLVNDFSLNQHTV